MFTFTLPIIPPSFSGAANQTYALPTLLATPQSTTPKLARKKRVRNSKFYKSDSGSVFGYGRKYLVEYKDGCFYYTYLDGVRELVENVGTIYKNFRGYAKNGIWLETTLEKELAAN